MLMTIALLSLVFFLVAVLLLRPSPALSTPRLIPITPPQPRHVSFSLDVTTGTPKRKTLARSPHLSSVHSTLDQFGRIICVSDVPKPSRRLSLPSRRRSSCTSTLILDVRTPSPPPSTFETRSRRTRFTNPFTKHSRSRTLSPPSTLNSLVESSNPPSTSPSSLPARRRTLSDKFKSIFKSTPSETYAPMIPKPSFRLRRKPVARTQPYGPPWNAPMPVPDFDLSQHSFQKPAQSMSSQSSRKHSIRECSRPAIASMSPGQLSPRTFINELDEKLHVALLQQQRMQDSITLSHR